MALTSERKRIFVRGLHMDVTEDDIRQKFKSFGEINSIEIKQGYINDQQTFAFVDMTAIPNNFSRCLATFSGTVWKGNELKLEMAKESFLSRLKRERESRNTNDLKSKSVENSSDMPPSISQNEKCGEDSNYSQGVPKFKGNNAFKRNAERSDLMKLKDFEHSNSKKSKQHKFPISETKNGETVPSSSETSAFLTKLENFSGGVWGEERPDTSFEIVKEGFSSNRSAADDANAIKTRSNGLTNKHLLSNEKRLNSLQLKQSTVDVQQNIVKEALSKVSTPNRKVFYTSDDEDAEVPYSGTNNVIQDENEKDETFNQKSQFNDINAYFEKNKQFQGDDFKKNQSSGSSETKKRHWTEFVSERYDPTSKDHTKYEVKRQQYDVNVQPKKENVNEKMKGKKKGGEERKKASGERFFEVAESLCDIFAEKPGKSFSVTELFDSNKGQKPKSSKNYERNSLRSKERAKTDSYNNNNSEWSRNEPTNQNSNFTPINETPKVFHTASEDNDRKPVVINESFFIFNGDARLKEGIECFHRSDDLEAIESNWEAKIYELRSVFNEKRKRMADLKLPMKKHKIMKTKGKNMKVRGKNMDARGKNVDARGKNGKVKSKKAPKKIIHLKKMKGRK